jgi:hypothetical protein
VCDGIVKQGNEHVSRQWFTANTHVSRQWFTANARESKARESKARGRKARESKAKKSKATLIGPGPGQAVTQAAVEAIEGPVNLIY